MLQYACCFPWLFKFEISLGYFLVVQKAPIWVNLVGALSLPEDSWLILEPLLVQSGLGCQSVLPWGSNKSCWPLVHILLCLSCQGLSPAKFMRNQFKDDDVQIGKAFFKPKDHDNPVFLKALHLWCRGFWSFFSQLLATRLDSCFLLYLPFHNKTKGHLRRWSGL